VLRGAGGDVDIFGGWRMGGLMGFGGKGSVGREMGERVGGESKRVPCPEVTAPQRQTVEG